MVELDGGCGLMEFDCVQIDVILELEVIRFVSRAAMSCFRPFETVFGIGIVSRSTS